MYKQALNKPQELIYHKTQPKQRKIVTIKPTKYLGLIISCYIIDQWDLL